MILPRAIQDYLDMIRAEEYPFCREQHQLADYIEYVFASEILMINRPQLEDYLAYEKYFPYRLFPWEKFLFALHNCVYRENGILRWPELFALVGRGAGKNGYLAFEDFCLLTDINGVDSYNIDIFATSERQAKTSWQDVYDVLETHEKKMRKHFRWTKELIRNTDTGSDFAFNTASPKTKDGYRPGKVDFDELHAYESYKLIDVAKTGLGKKRYPRETIITSDGLVRGGPLDDKKEKAARILALEIPDNGMLPFICRLDEDEEVHDKRMWYKANPSLQYFPDLMDQMEREYADYKENPIANSSFMIKRMNRPLKQTEENITSWDNILATNRPIDEEKLRGHPCVAGFDYMSTTDFLGAGLLFRIDDEDIWVTHTWVCKRSRDIPKIKAPLELWESLGLLTIVDAPEIPADLPAVWVANKAAELGAEILRAGIDKFRYQMMRLALESIGLYWEDRNRGNIWLLRPSNEMQITPSITSKFVSKRFVWGDNPVMRWAAWNSKLEISKAGNITYGKIEPASRKTDPFKALVAAECVSDVLDEAAEPFPDEGFSADGGVYVFD